MGPPHRQNARNGPTTVPFQVRPRLDAVEPRAAQRIPDAIGIRGPLLPSIDHSDAASQSPECDIRCACEFELSSNSHIADEAALCTCITRWTNLIRIHIAPAFAVQHVSPEQSFRNGSEDQKIR